MGAVVYISFENSINEQFVADGWRFGLLHAVIRLGSNFCRQVLVMKLWQLPTIRGWFGFVTHVGARKGKLWASSDSILARVWSRRHNSSISSTYCYRIFSLYHICGVLFESRHTHADWDFEKVFLGMYYLLYLGAHWFIRPLMTSILIVILSCFSYYLNFGDKPIVFEFRLIFRKYTVFWCSFKHDTLVRIKFDIKFYFRFALFIITIKRAVPGLYFL